MTKDKIKKEIEGMDSWVSISEIEKILNMPPTTLQKVLKGTRELPKKWHRVLEEYFIKKEPLEVDKKVNNTQITKKEKLSISMPTGLSKIETLRWMREKN